MSRASLRCAAAAACCLAAAAAAAPQRRSLAETAPAGPGDQPQPAAPQAFCAVVQSAQVGSNYLGHDLIKGGQPVEDPYSEPTRTPRHN